MDPMTDNSEHGLGTGVAMRMYRMLDELGSIAYLMGQTIVSAATPPYSYGPERTSAGSS
jgi:hypothetical protein